jgi:energy-converting hydrogenase Eha subunit E
MWLAFTHAWLLIGVLAVLVVLSLLLIRSLWRFLAGMFRKLSLPAFNPPHFSP